MYRGQVEPRISILPQDQLPRPDRLKKVIQHVFRPTGGRGISLYLPIYKQFGTKNCRNIVEITLLFYDFK